MLTRKKELTSPSHGRTGRQFCRKRKAGAGTGSGEEADRKTGQAGRQAGWKAGWADISASPSFPLPASLPSYLPYHHLPSCPLPTCLPHALPHLTHWAAGRAGGGEEGLLSASCLKTFCLLAHTHTPRLHMHRLLQLPLPLFPGLTAWLFCTLFVSFASPLCLPAHLFLCRLLCASWAPLSWGAARLLFCLTCCCETPLLPCWGILQWALFASACLILPACLSSLCLPCLHPLLPLFPLFFPLTLPTEEGQAFRIRLFLTAHCTHACHASHLF